MGILDAVTRFSNQHFIIALILRFALLAVLVYLAFHLLVIVLRLLFDGITTVLAWLYGLRIGMVEWFDDVIPGKLSSSPFDLLLCAAFFALLWFWAPSAAILQNSPIAPLQQTMLLQICGFQLMGGVVVLVWAISYICLGGVFGLPIAVVLKTLRIIIEIPYLPLTLLMIWGESDTGTSSGGGGMADMPLYRNGSAMPIDPGARNKQIYHGSGTDDYSGYHNPDDYGGGYTDGNGDTHYYRKETSAPEEAPVERDEDGYARFNP